MTTTLLIIDLQNDYFPGGRNPLVDSVAAAQQARRLLNAFRLNSQPVVHVQHLATRSEATFFIPGTPGVEIYPLVQPYAGEAIIQKHYPNSFRETALLGSLHDLNTRYVGKLKVHQGHLGRSTAQRGQGRWTIPGQHDMVPSIAQPLTDLRTRGRAIVGYQDGSRTLLQQIA
jgi:hypothetical protein